MKFPKLEKKWVQTMDEVLSKARLGGPEGAGCGMRRCRAPGLRRSAVSSLPHCRTFRRSCGNSRTPSEAARRQPASVGGLRATRAEMFSSRGVWTLGGGVPSQEEGGRSHRCCSGSWLDLWDPPLPLRQRL